MPKHDLPDGHEADSNVIDFRDRLRERVARTLQDNAGVEPDTSDRDIYRHAEYGDGKPPKFSRHDLLWLGVILAIAWIFWMEFHR